MLAPALRMTRRRTILMRDSSSVTWFKPATACASQKASCRAARTCEGGPVQSPTRGRNAKKTRIVVVRSSPRRLRLLRSISTRPTPQYYFAEHELANCRRRGHGRRAAAQAAEFEPLLATERDEILHWHSCSPRRIQGRCRRERQQADARSTLRSRSPVRPRSPLYLTF